MADQTTDRIPANRHEAIARGIEAGLRDIGGDLAGCTPSMLTGHVLRELRRVPAEPDVAEDSAESPSEAEERKAKLMRWLGAERDYWFTQAAELLARIADLDLERKRVIELAERWEAATELGTGTPSIVTRAFAAEVRAALEGTRSV